jgi:hypothetical protein
MSSKRPYSLILAGMTLMVGMACNAVTLNFGAPDTETPTPVSPTATPLPPTATQMPSGTASSTATPSQTPLPPTAKPTLTHSPIPPSVTPTISPTSGGLVLATFIHLPVVTLNAGIFVPLDPKLDYTANANYGEANLSAGFSPDPYSVGMTSGGDVNVSYLGGGCSGFATTSPDLRINFGGGGASLLRIYFVGSSGDTTMIVNDPYGNFYCVDDSFGTVNPTIDFNNPAGGTYDIWIGSYASGTFVSGTLYVTANSGNHP